MLLQIPLNAKTWQMTNSVIWFDESGIMYSRPKMIETPMSKEETVAEVEKLLEITGGKKVCIILESRSSSKPPKKEDREFIAQQLDRITKALAIVTSSAVSRMIANLFFSFKPPGYPVKIFSNELEARNWVKAYL